MILKIVDDDRQTCVIVTRIDRRKDLPWGDDAGGDYSIWINGFRHSLSQA